MLAYLPQIFPQNNVGRSTRRGRLTSLIAALRKMHRAPAGGQAIRTRKEVTLGERFRGKVVNSIQSRWKRITQVESGTVVLLFVLTSTVPSVKMKALTSWQRTAALVTQ
jgi:hypothetical protein